MKSLYERSDEIPIIGQECICPDGLGRVISYDFEMPNYYIRVHTYINPCDRNWDRDSVTLIPIYI